MLPYHHEQIGRIYILVLALVGASVLGLGGFAAGQLTIATGFFLVIVAIVWAFAQLTIDVDNRSIRWSMTFGFPGGEIPFDQIVSAQIVPVNFWMGIGIHLTLRGWVWNVSLGQGVQIMRPNGIAVVLGTDDPQGLIEAITRARAA
jgi:hypothetical protein